MIPNPDGAAVTPDVIKRLAQETVQNQKIYEEHHWIGANEEYYASEAGIARAGIKEYKPYGNGNFQVFGKHGEDFWCTAQQLQDMNDGKKTMLDVMEENGVSQDNADE